MHSQLCCDLKKAGAHVIPQSVRISAQGSRRHNKRNINHHCNGEGYKKLFSPKFVQPRKTKC